ncbi:hypothetical protein ACIQMR_14755 [Streptomyces sp. NPDC091376]|uniref:hypothetical protein n=1 Tax=Streptomyces sp. NPDC091376 TaxID=3365994 RepID=UPI0037F4986C
MVASFVMGLFLAASQPAGELLPLWQRSLLGLAMNLGIGYPSQLLVRAGVVLEEDRMLLRNKWEDVSVPYEIIQRLTTSDGLRVELKDGRILKSAAVPTYLGGRLTGYQSAKRVRRAVQPYLTPSDPAPDGLDIHRRVQLSSEFAIAVLTVHGLWFLLLLAVEP